jgi:hypothetical protein
MASSVCSQCNKYFSIDQEYLRCLLECVLADSTLPEQLPGTVNWPVSTKSHNQPLRSGMKCCAVASLLNKTTMGGSKSKSILPGKGAICDFAYLHNSTIVLGDELRFFIGPFI